MTVSISSSATMTFFLGQLNASHRGRRNNSTNNANNSSNHQHISRRLQGPFFPHEINQHWDGLAMLGVNPRTLRIGRSTRERMAAEAAAYAEGSRAERAEILTSLVRDVGTSLPWTHSFNCFTSDEGALGRCDFASYLYFMLSTILFTVGALVTVFGFVNYAPVFGPKDRAMPEHVWLVGPIFVCSGLLVGCKTILHMRRKKMLYQVLRLQNIINWELQNERRIDRNPSVLTLPPPYDIALAMPTTNTPQTQHQVQPLSVTSNSLTAGNETQMSGLEEEIGGGDMYLQPPSYEDALRILAQLKDEPEAPVVQFRNSGHGHGHGRAQVHGIRQGDEVQGDCTTRLLPLNQSETSDVVVNLENGTDKDRDAYGDRL